MDNITLTGITFFGYHGALTEENKIGQRFIVDVVMELSLQEAGRGDKLELSINYAEVYGKVQAIIEGRPYKTIEAVAEKITEALFAAYSILANVKVTVHKPEAPIPGIFQDVSVTIERSR